MKIPTAPRSLSPDSRKLWRAILEDYPINDRAHLTILEQSLLALDRSNALRAEIDQAGPTVQDRFGQSKANPLLAAERDARNQFFGGMKSLYLDPGTITKGKQ